ncbi:MAG: hypothetical protein QOC55_860 [Thermoleophilaceae bacterium]|nr:hypothetical protein [Thermoleophilaceae bacterium]
MLALLLLTAALAAASFTTGQAILALCGWQRWTWWAPAVGYGLLLIVGGQVVRLPGRATTAAVIIVVLALASLALPFVRTAVREAAAEAVPLGILMILLAAVPFFVAGHTGVLGAGVSNDMSQHLTAAFWLRTHASLLPAAAIGGDLITTGYPIGPHGLTAALTAATGLGEEDTFSAVTIVVPLLTAFAALAVVPTARRGARWALAIVIGIGYLPAAYLAQGSFKETIEAMYLLMTALAFAELLRDDAPARGVRRGIPFGVIVAATVYTYSYGGAFWIIGAVGVLFVAEVVRHPRALPRIVRATILPALAGVLTAAILLAREARRIINFTNSIFGVEPKKNHGNLVHALNPFETFGTWFSGDFRFNPSTMWPSMALSILALGALLASVGWWWRRRSLALPAAVVAGIVIWVDLALTRNIYNAAKGLVVLAPVVAACLGAPLIAAWDARPAGRRRLVVTARVVGAVLLIGAAIAGTSVLRSAPVGLGPHEKELASVRNIVHGKTVFFISNDHFAEWELRGARRLYTTNSLYAPAHLGMHPQKYGGIPLDVDNYGSHDLNHTHYVLQPAGRFASEIPPNFKLVLRTPSYELYRRSGKTPERLPAEPIGVPGALLDCNSPRVKGLIARYKVAGVLPTPVVSDKWTGTTGRPGQSARVRVTLPRGRWDISLEYFSQTGLDLHAPGFEHKIPSNFGTITPFWPAGTLTSNGSPLTLTVTARPRASWFGRLVGTAARDRGAGGAKDLPLWHVAFTRHGATPRRVPATQACGRYVDWLAPAGGAMKGRSPASG